MIVIGLYFIINTYKSDIKNIRYYNKNEKVSSQLKCMEIVENRKNNSPCYNMGLGENHLIQPKN